MYSDIRRGVEGLRIGLDREYALMGVDSGQAASIEQALKLLESLGARIVEVQMPSLTGIVEASYLLCSSEAVAAHAATYPSRAQDMGLYFREFLQTRCECNRGPADEREKGSSGVRGACALRPRRCGCHRVPERWSASVSDHTRDAVRLHDSLQRVRGGVPRGQQPEDWDGVHPTRESRGYRWRSVCRRGFRRKGCHTAFSSSAADSVNPSSAVSLYVYEQATSGTPVIPAFARRSLRPAGRSRNCEGGSQLRLGKPRSTTCERSAVLTPRATSSPANSESP